MTTARSITRRTRGYECGYPASGPSRWGHARMTEKLESPDRVTRRRLDSQLHKSWTDSRQTSVRKSPWRGRRTLGSDARDARMPPLPPAPGWPGSVRRCVSPSRICTEGVRTSESLRRSAINSSHYPLASHGRRRREGTLDLAQIPWIATVLSRVVKGRSVWTAAAEDPPAAYATRLRRH